MSFSGEKSNSLQLLYNRLAPEVKAHCIRVALVMQILFCEAMARKPRIFPEAKQVSSDNAMQLVLECGFYHDLGKIMVPRQIFEQKRKLTQPEFAQVQKHTTNIQQLLPPLHDEVLHLKNFFGAIIEVALFHHERWDGTGYPRGLAQENIPVLARMCSLADAYDAMTHNQNYAPKRSHEEAMQEIHRCAGTQFDPFLAKMFLSCSKQLKTLASIPSMH